MSYVIQEVCFSIFVLSLIYYPQTIWMIEYLLYISKIYIFNSMSNFNSNSQGKGNKTNWLFYVPAHLLMRHTLRITKWRRVRLNFWGIHHDKKNCSIVKKKQTAKCFCLKKGWISWFHIQIYYHNIQFILELDLMQSLRFTV